MLFLTLRAILRSQGFPVCSVHMEFSWLLLLKIHKHPSILTTLEHPQDFAFQASSTVVGAGSVMSNQYTIQISYA